jgi:tripartite-type tricarboxylate transporter receptor subunit TctC
MKTHSATVGVRRRARDLRWRLAACIVALAALCPAIAGAQAPYPARSVRIVVPYAVGGIADTFSRLLAVALAESTGQAVVTDNRPGGSGLVGSDIVAKAPPDGGTLLVSGLNSYWIKSGLGVDVPFHPLRDLTPIAFMVSSSWIVVVHPSVQATTLRELVDLAKSQPAALNYGSAGYGSFSQLFLESIKHRAGIDVTHVPYKGEGEVVTALLRGDVAVAAVSTTAALPYVKAGRLRALAATGTARSSAFPDLPTVAETLPGAGQTGFIGLFGPAGLPPDIVLRLNDEVRKLLTSPELRGRLQAYDANFVDMTPAQFAEFQRAEIAIWVGLARATRLQLD